MKLQNYPFFIFKLFIFLLTVSLFVAFKSNSEQPDDKLLFRPVKDLPAKVIEKYQRLASEYPETRRHRFVKVNFDMLEKAAAGRSRKGRIVLNPFRNVRIPVEVRHLKRESRANFISITTYLQADFYGKAVLVFSKEYSKGIIHLDYNIYELVPLGDGYILLLEIIQANFPPEDCSDVLPSLPSAPLPSAPSKQPIRLMLLFGAEDYQDRVLQKKYCIEIIYQNLLNETFNEMNSHNISFEVFAKYLPNYHQPSEDLGDDLDFLKSDTEVALMRDRYTADLVCLLVRNGELCGITNGAYPPSSSTSHKAFSVAKQSCALSGYSIAHEIGHQFGMRHNRYAEEGGHKDACNYGYVNCEPGDLVSNYFRTIMGSNQEFNCAITPIRLGTFSNPEDMSDQFTTIRFGISCDVLKTGENGSANNCVNIGAYVSIISRYR